MIVTRDPKTFCFNFDLPKDVDENLKHEIEFIIKTNESLAENKIKNETEQLLLKYKYGNNINEHLVLVLCNLVHNQYQQKSEVLYAFTPNKSHVYLLNVELSNSVFLKTYNTKFDEIIITCMDQNGRPLE